MSQENKEKLITDLLRIEGFMTQTMIISKTGFSESTVRSIIKRLVDRKIIKQGGKRRGAIYSHPDYSESKNKIKKWLEDNGIKDYVDKKIFDVCGSMTGLNIDPEIYRKDFIEVMREMKLRWAPE